jgi:PAS domain S-box-containing protein
MPIIPQERRMPFEKKISGIEISNSILLVDPEPLVRESMQELLEEYPFHVYSAANTSQACRIFKNHPIAVVIVDSEGGAGEIRAMTGFIGKNSAETTLIVTTGDNEHECGDLLANGMVYDILRKPFDVAELVTTVNNALNHRKLWREKEEIHSKLAYSENRYRYLVQNSPDIIYMTDERGNFTFVNEAAERMLNAKCDELRNRHFSFIICEEDLQIAERPFLERRTGKRANSGVQLRVKRASNGTDGNGNDENYILVELKSTGIYNKPVLAPDKRYLGTMGIIRDISERTKLHNQLQQAERMKAVGTLSGGIAHDFNNLLMGIQGNASIMLMKTPPGDPNYQRLKHIEEFVQRGVQLTRQLLGFARGGKYDVQLLDLNVLIATTADMFGRTKKEIQIVYHLCPELWSIKADKTQVEQVLLNLFVNSWHAMPGGGWLILETDNVELSEEETKPFGLEPGKFVKASVSDTGIGMNAATQARVFEPFFTTKQVGQGTGLGLASVYGIIENHHGRISLWSAPGQGTRFDIMLPAFDKRPEMEKIEESELLKGSENILIVDDESMILETTRDLLLSLGYGVCTASSGNSALDLITRACMAKKNNGAGSSMFDLVILDMIMPQMSGEETFNRIREIEPGLKVLLSSGYSSDGQAEMLIKKGCCAFLQKPFSLTALSIMLREVFDKRTNSEATVGSEETDGSGRKRQLGQS